ncbi:hypothetical protein F4805DRAFT_479142 [Annulohypoxylon moriforme]|nr:hypothetical protein F4805DRAFT_479142 [Annulohypoxylon moriforme]
MEQSRGESSLLESMPVELIIAILCELDSLYTLSMTISASPRCLEVYSAHKDHIARRVLFNHLDAHDVRPEALWALRMKGMVPMNQFHFGQLLTEFKNRDPDICPQLGFPQLFAMDRLHCAITRLTDAFARTASLTLPNPSVTEKGRIMRAFYYLEMYFACVRIQSFREIGPPLHPIFPHMGELLRCFAPWEIQQMTAINKWITQLGIESTIDFAEYLGKYPGDAAAHARELMAKRFDRNSTYIIMYQGFSNMEYLVNAAIDVGDRVDAWIIAKRPPQTRRILTFRGELIWRANRTLIFPELMPFGPNSNAQISTIRNPEHWDSEVVPLWFSEPDDGPFHMWRATYRNFMIKEVGYSTDPFPRRMRTGGWYFWDRSRIEDNLQAQFAQDDVSPAAETAMVVQSMQFH